MKIALVGYGKMGRMIEEIARSRGHEIVSIIDVENASDFESEAFRSAEVAIEFTAPHAALGNVRKCFEAGVKVVSGSTGWLAGNEAEMKQFCEGGKQTLLWSSNFSVGVAVFSAVNKYLARIMNNYPNYEVSMTEVHHIHKLDAPSGTAITLAEGAIENLDRKDSWVLSELSGEVSPNAVADVQPVVSASQFPIHSVREGEVPGIHFIRYEGEADSITITHDAKNRKGLALGAVLAAELLANRTGFLTINDLFSF